MKKLDVILVSQQLAKIFERDFLDEKTVQTQGEKGWRLAQMYNRYRLECAGKPLD